MYGDVDFYSLKGVIEELFSVLGIAKYDFVPEKKMLHFILEEQQL